MRYPNTVPRAPVSAIIEDWCTRHRAEHNPAARPSTVAQHQTLVATDQAGALETLAFHSGVSVRTLLRIRTGRYTDKRLGGTVQQESVPVATADKILTGIGRPDLWHSIPELAAAKL